MVARTEYPCLSRWSTTHISDEAISFSKEDLARCYDRHFRYQKQSRIWMGKPEALNEPVNEIGYLYIGSPLVLERWVCWQTMIIESAATYWSLESVYRGASILAELLTSIVLCQRMNGITYTRYRRTPTIGEFKWSMIRQNSGRKLEIICISYRSNEHLTRAWPWKCLTRQLSYFEMCFWASILLPIVQNNPLQTERSWTSTILLIALMVCNDPRRLCTQI